MSEAKFTHTPVAPYLPSEAANGWQRWFQGTNPHSNTVDSDGDRMSGAQVFRDGGENVAEVRLVSYGRASQFSVHVTFGPSALREIAQRILDAAVDIEANPAKEG